MLLQINPSSSYQQMPNPEQKVKLLRIYNIYRLLLSLILPAAYLGAFPSKIPTDFSYSLPVITELFYFLFNIAITASVRTRTNVSTKEIFAITAADIIFLVFILHFHGGINSGIGNIIIVSVAAGSILIPNRISTALAALASIGVIYEAAYSSLLPEAKGHFYFQAGLSGATYFATSYFVKTIATRLRTSEQLASERARSIETLEELNHQIIQRMRTGIMVSTADGSIRMMNESAETLLQLETPITDIQQASAELSDRLNQWSHNNSLRSSPFRTTHSAPEVQASFASLDKSVGSDILIFLEDISNLARHAQQLKLASLGRLTAGIAHEIRNPLGAISHAAQLMSESPNLDKGDLRLTEIIQDHSVRMNHVIENVLQLSRRKATQPQSLTLKDWLDSVCQKFLEGEYHDAQININIQPENTVIQSDPSQLEQVLTNLIQNGLRYSYQNTGQYSLTLTGGSNSLSDQPYLDIVDQGTGINTEVALHIFEPFYTTEAKGTGLGLFLARELCEANHCRLDHLPSDNGCCFRITFPHSRKVVG